MEEQDFTSLNGYNVKDAKARTDIEVLKTDNDTNKTNIDALQTDNATNKTNIEALQTDNENNKTAIQELQSRPSGASVTYNAENESITIA